MAETGKKERGISFVADLAASLCQSVQSVFSGSDKPVKYSVMGLLAVFMYSLKMFRVLVRQR